MALADFSAGTALDLRGTPIVLADDIAYGHKFAVCPIAAGQPVIKFDETIGEASCDIAAGAHVHVHNVRSLRGGGGGRG
jgi:Altronate dehydratase